MSTRTKRLGCTVAVIAALALGACGGGGTKTTQGKSSTVRTAAGATLTSSKTKATPDGSQQSAVSGGTAAPTGALQPGAKTTIAPVFANAAVGGTLTFGAFGAAPAYDHPTVSVKVG